MPDRDLGQVASLFGLRKLTLMQKLRAEKILIETNEIAAKYRERGLLYADARQYWHEGIQGWKHYSIVMVTEAGVSFIAGLLGIKPARQKPRETA